jgi:hypothetical protein
MGRITLVSLMVFLAVTGVGAGAGRPAPGFARCPPLSRHRRVTADASAAVYWVKVSRNESQYRGCARHAARGVFLGETDESLSNPGGGATSHVVLAGSMVADERFGVHLEHEWVIEVWNLASARVIARLPTGPAPEKSFVGDGPTEEIVLKRTGAVAWIVDTLQDENRYEVRAHDSRGSRLLAVGSDIDPRSLALAGSTVYWTQAGKPSSAKLD